MKHTCVCIMYACNVSHVYNRVFSLPHFLAGVGSGGTLVYSGFTTQLGVRRPAAIKQMLIANYAHAVT